MHNYTPFVVTSIARGASRSHYEGVYMVEGYDEEYFSQHGWRVIR
jgi:hypothetical protein